MIELTFFPAIFHDAISVFIPQIIYLFNCEGYTDDEATTRK